MRVVQRPKFKKVLPKQTGGKSHRKPTIKQRDELKTKAVAAVMSNMVGQAAQLEKQALKFVIEKYLGRTIIETDVEKITKKKTEKGYILCYGDKDLAHFERQHATDKNALHNYKVVVTNLV